MVNMTETTDATKNTPATPGDSTGATSPFSVKHVGEGQQVRLSQQSTELLSRYLKIKDIVHKMDDKSLATLLSVLLELVTMVYSELKVKAMQTIQQSKADRKADANRPSR